MGTVTFLFTDIEGSTRLQEDYPQLIREVLIRHDSILWGTVGAYDGTSYRHIGDGICAAFANASDAVAAALQAQQHLAQEDWGAVGAVRVRMGIHTGEAEERQGNYFGSTLNHVSRIMSAGHGGQVLLSNTAADLVRDHLPQEAGLHDLGTHKLRDISHEQNIFQLIHPSLRREFPALRSLDRLVGNLPIQVTSFVGREDEIQEVSQLLNETRLLTLTGIGGVGKTRLSIQLGSRFLESCPDGVWFVELAPVVDPSLLRQEVASALRVVLGALEDFLRDKSLLIILDNCEHLLEACAQVAHEFLQLGPQIRILATSREGLGVSREVIHRVPSLTIPEPREDVPDTLLMCEAVRLFVERAVAVGPGFTLTRQNGVAVSQIVRRLDGIPLAIELAASRVKGLPVQQIMARLDDRFRLLTGGSRTALPRQRTLQAAIDWSYQVLSESEALLFNKLSVFRGGFTIEAVEQVGAGADEDSSDVLDILLQLVDKSLVLAPQPGPEGTARYGLLETLRQYGGERLVESGVVEETRSRHTSYFANWIHELQPLLWGENPGAALDSVETDYDNMRAALDWSLASGDAETALKLVGDGTIFLDGASICQ